MSEELILTPEDAALLVECLTAWHEGRTAKAGIGHISTMLSRLKHHAALVPPPLNGDSVWAHNAYIVRARTKTEAVRLLNATGRWTTISRFNAFFTKTSNREHLFSGAGLTKTASGPRRKSLCCR